MVVGAGVPKKFTTIIDIMEEEDGEGDGEVDGLEVVAEGMVVVGAVGDGAGVSWNKNTKSH